MHYTFNRFIFYGTPLLILAMIVVIFGCQAENPVCSENFCVLGEIFPRSDLEDSEYTEFSEVDVDDSRIIAVLAGTETLTTPEKPTSTRTVSPPEPEVTRVNLEDIVVNTLNGGRDYVGKIVYVKAKVQVPRLPGQQLRVRTGTSVRFYINDFDHPSRIADPVQNWEYDFVIKINDISSPINDEENYYTIWAEMI